MADIAAKREARRKRILENSENRLKKITGNFMENSNDEISKNDINTTRCKMNNGLIENKSITTENDVISEKKYKDLLKQDNSSNIENYESTGSNVQYQATDNHFNFNPLNHSFSFKENRNCDNSNFKSTSSDQLSRKQQQYSWLYSLLSNSWSCIFLAAFVNILFVTNVNSFLNKSIITPYIIMAITQLCLQHKSEESQENSMLVAALILCNVKPEIVYNLKKILILCNTIFRDFALYLTSFTLFHWFILISWADLHLVQFF